MTFNSALGVVVHDFGRGHRAADRQIDAELHDFSLFVCSDWVSQSSGDVLTNGEPIQGQSEIARPLADATVFKISGFPIVFRWTGFTQGGARLTTLPCV